MTTSIGIDVGSSLVKTTLVRVENGRSEWLASWDSQISQRDVNKLAEESIKSVLKRAGLKRSDVDFIATTGDGESVKNAGGHFHSISAHALGALQLNPEARTVLDIGLQNCSAISIDGRGKVLNYRMSSQYSTGIGQFLDNIALNMMTRSVGPGSIRRGIHDSMAERLIKLLKSIDVRRGTVMLTGGLALDAGLVRAVQEGMERQKMATRIATCADSLYAGAIGAGLLGAFCYERLDYSEQFQLAS